MQYVRQYSSVVNVSQAALENHRVPVTSETAIKGEMDLRFPAQFTCEKCDSHGGRTCDTFGSRFGQLPELLLVTLPPTRSPDMEVVGRRRQVRSCAPKLMLFAWTAVSRY